MSERPKPNWIQDMIDDSIEQARYDVNHTPLLDAIMRGLPDRPPPSRYKRLRWRIAAAKRRVGDAWRVLRHGLPERDW